MGKLCLLKPNSKPFTEGLHFLEAAHKKGSGSTKNGRDSNSKRRGIKIFGNQHVLPGNILIRQIGNKFHKGLNVGCGKNFTLYALKKGILKYERLQGRRCISVYTDNSDDIEYSFTNGLKIVSKLEPFNTRKVYTESSLN